MPGQGPISSGLGPHPGCWVSVLTRRVERGEVGGNFSQCMPPASAAGQGFLDLLLLLQAGTLPGLLTDSCVQQAAGGDGPVPEHSAAVGIQGEEQRLKRAVEITVYLGLQDRLSQGLRLRAQQRGPERVTWENFLRNLQTAEV